MSASKPDIEHIKRSTEESQRRSSGPDSINTIPDYAMEDEIDLLDLLVVFVKHKKVMLIAFVVPVLLSLLAALLISSKYNYTTRFELGLLSNNELLEPADAVVAKLTQGYVPTVLHDAATTNDDISTDLIKVSSPKKSNIIVLSSAAIQDKEELVTGLQQQVANQLLTDHRQRINIEKSKLEAGLYEAKVKLLELKNDDLFNLELQKTNINIEKAKSDLKDIQQEKKSFGLEIKNLEFQKSLLKKQNQLAESRLKEIEELTQRLDKQREQAVKRTGEASSAMTLMLLDGERLRLNNQRTTEIEKINVELVTREQKLGTDIIIASDKLANLDTKDTKLKYERDINIAKQEQSIAQIKAQIEGIVPTRILAGPSRSIQDITNKKLFLLAGLVLGLFAAFAAVIYLEISRKLKQRLADEAA